VTDRTVHDAAERASGLTLRRAATDELTGSDVAAIRALLEAAFGPEEDERFTDDDWEHASGGRHFILELDGEIVAHGSVVERELRVAGQPLRTGYVEAVAVAPARQAGGFGSRLMEAIAADIAERFELGALGTGRHRFYERLGWRSWAGPSFVRMPDGERATPDEDGYIMVLATPTTPPVDRTGAISCDWRPGDIW